MSEIRSDGPAGLARRAAVDAAVILAVVGGGSWLLDHNPDGWLATNPSPFFLLPLLLGGRYGLIVGILGGLLAAAVAAAGSPAAMEFEPPLLTLLAFPVAGLICGEVSRMAGRQGRRDAVELAHARARLRALDNEVHLLGQAKAELDREVALAGSRHSTLDFEIRRVLQSPEEKFCESLLGLLCRRARLEEAAIYHLVSGEWKLAASTGIEGSWSASLDPSGSPVVKAALTSSQMASLPEIWSPEAPFDPRDYLLACPLGAPGQPRNLLVVRSMPFTEMNRPALRSIEVICRWVSEFIGVKDRREGLFDPRGLVPEADFRSLLALACEVQRTLRLSSSVIVFEAGGASPGEIFSALEGATRVGDVFTESASGRLLLLLPLTGLRGAEICLARFREHAKTPDGGEISGVITTTDAIKNPAAFPEEGTPRC